MNVDTVRCLGWPVSVCAWFSCLCVMRPSVERCLLLLLPFWWESWKLKCKSSYCDFLPYWTGIFMRFDLAVSSSLRRSFSVAAKSFRSRKGLIGAAGLRPTRGYGSRLSTWASERSAFLQPSFPLFALHFARFGRCLIFTMDICRGLFGQDG